MKIFDFFRKTKTSTDDHTAIIKLECFIIEGVKVEPRIDFAETFLAEGATVSAIGSLVKRHNDLKKGDFIKISLIEKIINENNEVVLKTKDKCYLVKN